MTLILKKLFDIFKSNLITSLCDFKFTHSWQDWIMSCITMEII